MEPVAGVALDWTVINYQWVRGGEVSATADSFKFTGCLSNAVLVSSTRRVSVSRFEILVSRNKILEN